MQRSINGLPYGSSTPALPRQGSRATSSIRSAAVPGALPVFHVAVLPAQHVARFIGLDAEGGAALRVLVDHRARAVDLAVSLAELVPIGAAALGFAERSATAEKEHEAQGCTHPHNVHGETVSRLSRAS